METPAWTYNGAPVTDEVVAGAAAFVYLIRHTATGRSYVGKKIFTRKITRKPLKGKTRKRHSTAPSDWMTYWGSSNELTADLILHGHDAFTREILHLCRTRAESSYLEAREQFDRRVLETDGWYNGTIMVRVHRSHIKKTQKKS